MQLSAFVQPKCAHERHGTTTRRNSAAGYLVDWRSGRKLHSPDMHSLRASPQAHSFDLISLVLADTSVASAAITPPATTTFEPILNLPALVTFLLITSIFSALILRTNQVEQAVQERNIKLQRLRDIKSKELAGEDSITKDDVQLVLLQYEQAVRNEEALRNVIPGVVRIVPPSAGDDKEEEASAIAKQMLGKDFDIGVPKRERTQSGQLSGVAVGALTLVAMLLMGQFVFLGWMYINDPTSPMTSGSLL